MTITPQNIAYTQGGGSTSTKTFVDVFLPRAPTGNDLNYQVQQKWCNTLTSYYYVLVGFTSLSGSVRAIWKRMNEGAVNEIVTPSGGPVLPSSGIVTFAEGPGLDIVGSGSTVTFNLVTPSYTDTLTTSSGSYTTITSIPVAAGTSIVLEGQMIGSNAGHTDITGGDLMVVADGTAAAIVGFPVINVQTTTTGIFKALFSGGNLLVQVQAPSSAAYNWKFTYTYSTVT
tara:strand:- start:5762 stop:6445 length:684 start_codon:yes stop_codon:yes gene_type:complete